MLLMSLKQVTKIKMDYGLPLPPAKAQKAVIRLCTVACDTKNGNNQRKSWRKDRRELFLNWITELELPRVSQRDETHTEGRFL